MLKTLVIVRIIASSNEIHQVSLGGGVVVAKGKKREKNMTEKTNEVFE